MRLSGSWSFGKTTNPESEGDHPPFPALCSIIISLACLDCRVFYTLVQLSAMSDLCSCCWCSNQGLASTAHLFTCFPSLQSNPLHPGSRIPCVCLSVCLFVSVVFVCMWVSVGVEPGAGTLLVPSTQSSMAVFKRDPQRRYRGLRLRLLRIGRPIGLCLSWASVWVRFEWPSFFR